MTTALLAARIHDVGGLSSLNHPFSGAPATATQTKQDSLRRTLAKTLIGNRAYGVDILEVGYQSLQGVGIATHLALWDTLSRNAIFLTGNGVNDSHGGSWAAMQSRFLTWAWAVDSTESSLLAALASGRIWIGEPSFGGMVDLLVDGVAPMGSVTVSDLAARELQIMLTGAPEGGTVKLVRGPVDYAGATLPDPNTVSQSYAASDFATGSVAVSVDTTASTFARIEVLDSTGRVVAVSNPVWLLRADPPEASPPPGRSSRRHRSSSDRLQAWPLRPSVIREPACYRLEPLAQQELVAAGIEHASIGTRHERGPPGVRLGTHGSVVGRVDDERGDAAVDHARVLDVLRDRGVGEERPHRAAARGERLTREVADDLREDSRGRSPPGTRPPGGPPSRPRPRHGVRAMRAVHPSHGSPAPSRGGTAARPARGPRPAQRSTRSRARRARPRASGPRPRGFPRSPPRR